MDIYSLSAVVVLLVAVVFAIVQNRKKSEQIKQFEERFAEVLDVDKEVESVTAQKVEVEGALRELRSSYAEKRAIFDKLVKESAIYDEMVQLAELGFYKPHFDFDASEEYKNLIGDVRGAQKKMLTEKTAIFSSKEWVLDGSKAKGKTMMNRGIRLTARAFNNECEAAVSNVSWNNVQRMEQRIGKAFDAINKLNESQAIEISPKYRDLKLKELRLTHEYRNKRQEEKEEQAEIRRRMREEAKLQQESEKALSEEKKYERLLEKAKQEAIGANAAKLESLRAKIDQLNEDLKSAHEKSERAKSMAEQTKSGHIYIVSNIGSFGENVYKIGMTRRLDPMDRVKELGDASVPFVFDVHAMIYTEDAPTVENVMQKSFDSRRVNLVNNRKEFFNVTLGDIRGELLKSFPEAEFVEVGEAKEYRETLALREQLANVPVAATEKYPDEI